MDVGVLSKYHHVVHLSISYHDSFLLYENPGFYHTVFGGEQHQQEAAILAMWIMEQKGGCVSWSVEPLIWAL